VKKGAKCKYRRWQFLLLSAQRLAITKEIGCGKVCGKCG
jgi:hypothetical protein